MLTIAIQEYIDNLENFKQNLNNKQFNKIYQDMKSINHIKNILSGTTIK